VKKEIVLSIGIADLDKKLLEKLCNWAEVSSYYTVNDLSMF